MGDKGNVCMLLERKPDKLGRGRQWCGWRDNIKMDLTEIGWEGVNWNILSKIGRRIKLLSPRQ